MKESIKILHVSFYVSHKSMTHFLYSMKTCYAHNSPFFKDYSGKKYILVIVMCFNKAFYWIRCSVKLPQTAKYWRLFLWNSTPSL